MKQMCSFRLAAKAKRFSASGGFCPLIPDQELCPEPRYRLTLARSPFVSTPHFWTWRRPGRRLVKTLLFVISRTVLDPLRTAPTTGLGFFSQHLPFLRTRLPCNGMSCTVSSLLMYCLIIPSSRCANVELPHGTCAFLPR